MSGVEKRIRQNEGAFRILEALGAADEELLERCETPAAAGETDGTKRKATKVSELSRRRKQLWRQGRAWAACLGLLVVGALSWYGLQIISPKGGVNSSGGANTGMSGTTWDTAAPESAAASEEGSEVSGETSGETSRTDTTVGQADNSMDGGADAGAGEAKTFENEELQDEEASQETCYSSDASREVTEEEARSWMPLGSYLPQNLPAGYGVESARINEESQCVTMTWTRGMDSILISVSKVEPGTVETVDVSRPETYDVRLYVPLYGGPYAEKVPSEYRETLDDPVFDFSDMDHDTGLELVSSRMISYSDAGDTDTPRGRFSVLIGEDILLYFNGRGTPEEIWAMLYSMKR